MDKESKARLRAVYFNFTAPLHIGNNRPDDYSASQWMLHSDTLYASIFYTWALLGRQDLIPSSASQPLSFSLSSLFPFTIDLKNSNKVRFFPKPLSNDRINVGVQDDMIMAKAIKKIQYFDQYLYEAWINGQLSNIDAADSIHGKYLTQDSINKHFISGAAAPRIRKPRDEGNPEIFYLDRLYFEKGSGLWCMVMANDEDWNHIKAAIKALGESGLGTDRNVGHGQFVPEFEDTFSIAMPTDGKFVTNLSLFCPNSSQQLNTMLANSRYDFIERGGWMSEPYNTYRKKTVFMFTEGSVFSIPETDENNTVFSMGNNVNLAPEGDSGRLKVKPVSHPVWRVGQSIFIKVAG